MCLYLTLAVVVAATVAVHLVLMIAIVLTPHRTHPIRIVIHRHQVIVTPRPVIPNKQRFLQ